MTNILTITLYYSNDDKGKPQIEFLREYVTPEISEMLLGCECNDDTKGKLEIFVNNPEDINFIKRKYPDLLI